MCIRDSHGIAPAFHSTCQISRVHLHASSPLIENELLGASIAPHVKDFEGAGRDNEWDSTLLCQGEEREIHLVEICILLCALSSLTVPLFWSPSTPEENLGLNAPLSHQLVTSFVCLWFGPQQEAYSGFIRGITLKKMLLAANDADESSEPKQ